MLPQRFLSICRIFVACSCIVGCCGYLAHGNEQIKIVDISVPNTETMWIDFVDEREVVSNYSLLTIVELSDSVSGWKFLSESELKELEDHYRFVVALGEGPKRFFRVISYGAESDIDGDGLSNEEEELLGTNVFVADSDGDGFSDGVEVENGTDPLDLESAPDASVLPLISFASSGTSRYFESDGTVILPVVASESDFTGLVHYELSSLSSTESEDFASLRGVVSMENGMGQIEVILTDDQLVESIETVTVELLLGESGQYRLGLPRHGSFIVVDNDGDWVMQLRDEKGSESTFRLCLLVGESGASGHLIGTEGSATQNEFGAGLPDGEWPLQVVWTETSFVATSVQIPMGSSMLVSEELGRSFRFEAIPPENSETPERAYLMERNIMIGEAVETVSSLDESSSYLGSENRYLFLMARVAPSIESGVIPLVEDPQQ